MPALTRHRQPEPLPILLHRRRIYVLPTRFGLYAGGLLLVMLLGALNFNNNAALLLTFALTGVLALSPLRAVQALERVVLERVEAEPVHADDMIELRLHWRSEIPRQRVGLEIAGNSAPVRFNLLTAADALVNLRAERRGWSPLPWISLSSDAPFGMFRAWSVLRPLHDVLVWPRPETTAAPLPDRGTGVARHVRIAEGEDWQGLRDYRPGDPPRRVAWKASARTERLLVRESGLPADGSLDLRWEDTAALPFEERISRLTRWIVDASAAGRRYRLQLPTELLGPASGIEFRNRCLRALALL